jgi:heat shock protein HtpX
MIKRILLFVITNILVVATLSTLTSFLKLHGYLNQYGLDYQALAIFCLIWGMGGSVISLCISRWIAKMAMGVQIINPDTAIGNEKTLLDTVHSLARKAELNTMPQVGIYKSDELNAFATGPTKNRALVAISTGLLQRMKPDEIEGVLGHEISHIANGDMVTMMLLQGTVNAFAMFLSRIIAYTISMALQRGNSEQGNSRYFPGMAYYLLTMVFDILFTLLGSIVVAAFSRHREYRADKGGAKLAGRQKMISALERLRLATTFPEEGRAPSLSSLKISRSRQGFLALLASHPDLTLRIKALSLSY